MNTPNGIALVDDQTRSLATDHNCRNIVAAQSVVKCTVVCEVARTLAEGLTLAFGTRTLERYREKTVH